MLYFERKFRKKGFEFIIGVDEAGRGPLAGPVVAAAVSLRPHRFKNRIDDSKKLTFLARERAFQEIILNCVFGIGVVPEATIDRVNILEATRLAMRQAIHRLIIKLKPKGESRIWVLIDGNMTLDIDFPYSGIVKGDSRSKSIACASILAKVTRDRIMVSYDKTYPQYRFIKHKGYPTQEHRDILRKMGPCSIHRRSFCCV
ncbi:MAG: ribonuclease HII [Candidatus Omnitrophota bacterium]